MVFHRLIVRSCRFLHKMALPTTAPIGELLTPQLRKVESMFASRGFELRFAGGCVRDLLSDIAPKDIDLATTANPDQMEEMFTAEQIRMLNIKGVKHGTVAIRVDDVINYEITALRIDLVCDGRHAEVQFTNDWEQDAARRDLTVNAMFCDLEGMVYDYFNGIEDLRNRRIRFVGDADERIQQDFLRILRYFRFHGRIAEQPDDHDEQSIAAVRRNVAGLQQISVERIWTELKQILSGRHADHVLVKMVDCGVGRYLGVADDLSLDEFQTVYSRCCHMKPHYMTLLSALARNDQEIYYMCTHLKTSGAERLMGVFIVENRQAALQAKEKSADEKLKFYQDLLLDQGPHSRETGPMERTLELAKYCADEDALQHIQSWTPPQVPVNGTDIIKEGNIPKGPYVKFVQSHLYELWKSSDYKMTREELIAVIPTIELKPIELPRKKGRLDITA